MRYSVEHIEQTQRQTLNELLAPFIWNDGLIYECLTVQRVNQLSDEQTLKLLVQAMAERHQHMDRVNKALAERAPMFAVGTIGV